MPTYEYVCTGCGNQWEEIQKISAPALTDCPKCSEATAKRQISAGNFILKGGGWYADLYSSSKPKAASGDAKVDTKAPAEGAAPAAPATSSTPTAPAAAPAAPAAAAPSTPSAPSAPTKPSS
jgi:putative FmdB family regulatory protein